MRYCITYDPDSQTVNFRQTWGNVSSEEIEEMYDCLILAQCVPFNEMVRLSKDGLHIFQNKYENAAIAQTNLLDALIHIQKTKS